MSDTARVARIPDCDLCRTEGRQEPAVYDGKTHGGPWGYMCEPHFQEYGVGLGTGRGQRLVVNGEDSG